MCFDNTFAKRDKIKNSTSLTLPSMTRTLGKRKYQGVSWTRYKLLLNLSNTQGRTSERWATTTMCWLQFHLHTDFTSNRKLRKSFLSMKFYSPHIKDEKINTGWVVTRVPLLTSWFSLRFSFSLEYISSSSSSSRSASSGPIPDENKGETKAVFKITNVQGGFENKLLSPWVRLLADWAQHRLHQGLWLFSWQEN